MVASGNLEVLLERVLPDRHCEVDINTTTTGYDDTWRAVVADFVERHSPGGLRTSINDGGARPDTVYLRLAAERAMMTATAGVNTHRGAIFGLGLRCAAAGAALTGPAINGWDRRPLPSLLSAIVRQRWGRAIACGPISLHSHGTAALLRFGAGGARAQAAAGFPHILAPEAAPVFEATKAALGGHDPRELVRRASADDLHANKAAQILCCTQAMAAWAVLSDVVPRPLVVAGYSVGELAA